MRVTDKYVFFWGGEFSQWYMIPILWNGVVYNCAEQAMMASKAKLFKDDAALENIMCAEHPKQQKQIGREIRNFNKGKWDAICRQIVFDINVAKFSIPELKSKMLEMGDRTFVEASPYDKIWGIGMKEEDRGVEDPANWKGTNWLGQCLTEVSRYLRSDQEADFVLKWS